MDVAAVERTSTTLLKAPTRELSPDLRACALSIEVGCHQGSVALIRTSPTRIGSARDNDVVLLDDGVTAHHAQLRRVDGRWALYAGASTRALPIVASARQAACLRSRYRLGSAELLLSQCTRDPRPVQARRQHQGRFPTAVLFAVSAVFAAALTVWLVQPAATVLPDHPYRGSIESLPGIGVFDAARHSIGDGHIDDGAARPRSQP